MPLTLRLQVVKSLVTLYHDFGQAGRAIEILEEQLAKHYASVDLTHINMLTDLYMSMVGEVRLWFIDILPYAAR
jgi:hypothetical protein